MRLLVCSDGSSWMPPTKGRKNCWMMWSLNPRDCSDASVVMSDWRNSSGALVRRRRIRWPKSRILSAIEPTGAQTRPEQRSGSSDRVADQVHRCTGPYQGTGFEPPEIEGSHVELCRELGICGEQHLESAVQAIAVDHVATDPAPDAIGSLEDNHVRPAS